MKNKDYKLTVAEKFSGNAKKAFQYVHNYNAMLHPTLHNKEKVHEWEDFLVETVTERLELVSTITPSK